MAQTQTQTQTQVQTTQSAPARGRRYVDPHREHKTMFRSMKQCDFVIRRDLAAARQFEDMLGAFAALPRDSSCDMARELHRCGGRTFTRMIRDTDMAYVALWISPAAIAYVFGIADFAFINYNAHIQRYSITIKIAAAAGRDAVELPGPIPLTRSETIVSGLALPQQRRPRRRGGRNRRRNTDAPRAAPPHMSPLVLPGAAMPDGKLSITMEEIEALTRPPVAIVKNWGDMLDADSGAEGGADEDSNDDMPELEDAAPEAGAADAPEAKK